MKHFILITLGLLMPMVMQAQETAAPAPAVTEMPVITLPVRIHLMQSASMPDMHTTLVEADVRRVLGKVNKVWAQAGIQFEIESILPVEAVPMPEEKLMCLEFTSKLTRLTVAF